MRHFGDETMSISETVKEIGAPFFPADCFLLSGLTKAERENALAILRPETSSFCEGNVVVHAGDAGGRLFFLLAGRVSVYRTGGEKPVLINRLRAGACFGAASLFTEECALTEIVAETDGRFTVVREADLARLFSAFPAASLNYIRFLSEKLVFLNRRVRDFSAATSDEKTACLLLNEADENGFATLKNVTSLIRTMNLSRASFYRSLSSFLSRGIISKDGNQIQIIKSKELKGILS